MIFKRVSRRTPILVLADILVMVAVVLIESRVRSGFWGHVISPGPLFCLALIIFPIIFYILDLYYPYKVFKPALTGFEISCGVLTGILILAACSYLDRSFILPRRIFFTVFLPIIPLIFLVRMLYDALFKSRILNKRTLIIGTGRLALDLAVVLDHTPYSGMSVVGAMTLEPKINKVQSTLGRVPILGSLHDFKTLMNEQGVSLILLALEPHQKVNEERILIEVFRRGIAVVSAEHLLESLTGVMPWQLIQDNRYMLELMSTVRMRPYLKLKRIFDVVVATGLFIVILPVFLFAILLLSVSGPQRIFFIQERIGLNGQVFRLIKLRSMTHTAAGKTEVTRLGQWLRKYRIDEIPQLLNVLSGDMSLVGPRPEIPYFVQRSLEKIPMYEAVFSVKPGLTGWAQVRFRYTVSLKDYREKFRYNLYYLKHMSFTLDVLILFKTVRIVLLGLGK